MEKQIPPPDPFIRAMYLIAYASRRQTLLAFVCLFLSFLLIEVITKWLIPVTGLTQVWVITSSLCVWFAALVWCFIIAVMRFFKRELLQYQTGPASLKNMPWRHLELLTAEIYERLGYTVKDRGMGSKEAKADGGIDLDIRKDGKYWVVQCKKWTQQSVGVEKIQQLHGAMTTAGADGAIFVSSSTFTEAAERYAYDNRDTIELIENPRLWDLVQAARCEDRAQELATASVNRRVSAEANAMPPKCAWCGAPMELKQPRERGTQFTPFWGCTNYRRTKCAYKLEITIS